VGAGSFAKEYSLFILFTKLQIALFIWVMHFMSETLDNFEFFFSKVPGRTPQRPHNSGQTPTHNGLTGAN
jgi:hypothetical protein